MKQLEVNLMKYVQDLDTEKLQAIWRERTKIALTGAAWLGAVPQSERSLV